MKCFKLSTLLVAAVVVSACGPETPKTRAESVAALTGTAATGKTVFDANCASCHGADGKGTASGANLTSKLSEPSVKFIGKVIDGVPGTAMSSYSALSDQQLADVYAYLKSLK